MDVGRALASGEDVPEIVVRAADAATSLPGAGSPQAAQEFRAAALAARAQGEAAVENFVAQVGFMGTLVGLPLDVRQAMIAGAIGGISEKKQFIGTFDSLLEKNVRINDSYENKGRRIIAAGARWRGKLLSDVLNETKLSLKVDDFDALNGVWIKRVATYDITPAWRRGFLVATGACEGSSERGPGQTAVYQTMAEAGGRAGFEAGQAIAHERFHTDSPVEINVRKAVTTIGGKVVRSGRLTEQKGWVAHYRGLGRVDR
jgi:hypothetical protein